MLEPLGSIQTKLNVGAHCTTTNLSLSNDIKSVSIVQQLMCEVVSTKNVVQECDRPTNKQKTQRLWVLHSAQSPSPTGLGMVIVVLEHVLARFVIRQIVSLLWGTKIWLDLFNFILESLERILPPPPKKFNTWLIVK